MVENFDEPGTTAKLRSLLPGENLSRATFIPAFHFTPELLKDTKQALTRQFSPIIDRIRRATGREFATSTIHAFTRNYDIIVALVVIRVDGGEVRPDVLDVL